MEDKDKDGGAAPAVRTTPVTMTKQQLDDYIKGLVGEQMAEVRKDNEAKGNDMVKAFRDGIAGFVKPVEASEEKGKKLTRFVIAKCAQAKGIENDYTKAIFADVQKALDSGVPPNTGRSPIVPPGYQAELIELLRNRTAIRKLNPMIVPMPYGQIQIPRQSGTAAAQYIGESAAQNASQPTFDSVTLVAKKLRVTVPVSNDLIMYSLPAAEQIVRDDMVNAAAVKEDLEFLRGAGTPTSPKGLRNWAVAANTFAQTGTTVAAVTTDLGNLVAALLTANIPMIRPGFIISPRTYVFLMGLRHTSDTGYAFRAEMLLGTLWGYPYAVTAQVPINLGAGLNESEIYLADFSEVLLGESSEMMVEVSNDAAYVDASGTMQAAFANDQTVVRLIARHDLAMRHDEAVAILTGVTY